MLLTLLKELRKRGKKRGLASFLPIFFSEFNKFKDTEAQM